MHIPCLVFPQDFEASSKSTHNSVEKIRGKINSFYDISPKESDNDTFVVEGMAYRHLARSLRVKSGDRVDLLDTHRNTRLECVVETIAKSSLTIKLIRVLPSPEVPHLQLLVGLCKNSTTDEIVEKSVELGISEICFFIGKHSSAALWGDIKRAERIDRILIAAQKQSGNPITPVVSFYNSLELALTSSHEHRLLSEDEWRIALSPLSAIPLIKTSNIYNSLSAGNVNFGKTSLIVGPEGGLAASEIELALEWSYLEASLGHYIMRTQTAIVSACATCMMLRQARSP